MTLMAPMDARQVIHMDFHVGPAVTYNKITILSFFLGLWGTTIKVCMDWTIYTTFSNRKNYLKIYIFKIRALIND